MTPRSETESHFGASSGDLVVLSEFKSPLVVDKEKRHTCDGFDWSSASAGTMSGSFQGHLCSRLEFFFFKKRREATTKNLATISLSKDACYGFTDPGNRRS